MVFLTVVTYGRRPFLASDHGRRLLREAIQAIKSTHSFQFFAIVLLPEHWHCVMTLPSGDSNYSTRMKRIKEAFTKAWLAEGGSEMRPTISQKSRGERGVWQPRFWEHTVRNADDLEACVDYIHWNPVKHGLVRRVRDWPWSSFHRFVREGRYDIDWGGTKPRRSDLHRDWGEP